MLPGKRGMASALEISARMLREAEDIDALQKAHKTLLERRSYAHEQMKLLGSNAYLAGWINGLTLGMQGMEIISDFWKEKNNG